MIATQSRPPDGPGARSALRSTRVVTPDGMGPATVLVTEGTIRAVLPYRADLPSGVRPEDLGDDVLLPGLVDTHVHINDPGRSEWEGFRTATRAAAAGGVTTVVDMPLNSLPPTTTPDALAVKRNAARGRVHVDVGFWGGAVPGNLDELLPLHRSGVFGFKCFLAPSGVEEFPPLTPDDLDRVMQEVAGFGGLLIVHAEDPRRLAAAPPPTGPRYAAFLASRPRAAENDAVAAVIAAAKRYGTRVHILHLSSAEALAPLEAARAEGVPVTAETCPHYLCLTAEEVPDGATEFKCCPPVREDANRELLWAGLERGLPDCVVSDHSPCTAELKTGDFTTAWGGISSLQLGLPAVWTEARARGRSLVDVARWMATAPARLAGLPTKGAIEPGRDADFAVLAPEEAFTVDPAALWHRNPVTAWAGRTLHGVVRSTYLRGVPVAGPGTAGEPVGRLLTAAGTRPSGPEAGAGTGGGRRP